MDFLEQLFNIRSTLTVSKFFSDLLNRRKTGFVERLCRSSFQKQKSHESYLNSFLNRCLFFFCQCFILPFLFQKLERPKPVVRLLQDSNHWHYMHTFPTHYTTALYTGHRIVLRQLSPPSPSP
ncbi:unnamed protein product [Haemonchus placei]|uniref:Uncharacterized protein n=1 Tax=Haemonchus placei TaxID=6290 RepID=A0A158QQ28_HAEPC|nr:unnamed protein product [Haemonchus placei]